MPCICCTMEELLTAGGMFLLPISEHVTVKPIRSLMRATTLDFSSICPIFYIPCYALAVLVCPCVCVKLHFHIKLVIRFIFFSICVACVLACFNFFFKEGEKNFEILLLGWLSKLFDKALVSALARGALAMCWQIGQAIHSFQFLYLAFHQKIPHQLGEFVF